MAITTLPSLWPTCRRHVAVFATRQHPALLGGQNCTTTIRLSSASAMTGRLVCASLAAGRKMRPASIFFGRGRGQGDWAAPRTGAQGGSDGRVSIRNAPIAEAMLRRYGSCTRHGLQTQFLTPAPAAEIEAAFATSRATGRCSVRCRRRVLQQPARPSLRRSLPVMRSRGLFISRVMSKPAA